MSLNISKDREKIIRQTLYNRAREIENILNEEPLFKELQEIRETLLEIDSNKPDFIREESSHSQLFIDLGNYNPKWPSAKKAKYILQNSGRKEMSTKSIANAIVEREPKIDRRALVSNLSAALGISARAGKLFTRRQDDMGDWLYSLKPDE